MQEHPHQMLCMLRKWSRITSKNRPKRSARRGADTPRSVTGQWTGWSGSDATHRVALALMRLSGPLAIVRGISEVHGNEDRPCRWKATRVQQHSAREAVSIPRLPAYSRVGSRTYEPLGAAIPPAHLASHYGAHPPR